MDVEWLLLLVVLVHEQHYKELKTHRSLAYQDNSHVYQFVR